ncbi:MAG: hypothetical protein WBZ36_19090 [Candidatus Nitrosopolaris sp.]
MLASQAQQQQAKISMVLPCLLGSYHVYTKVSGWQAAESKPRQFEK